MNVIIDIIKQLIRENRSEWMGVITYNYVIEGNNVANYYGYCSLQAYQQDLDKYKLAEKSKLSNSSMA